ncbi:SF3a splicing factor complex subunit [Coemansia javaensis]|uniref:SF3a splicing factor complex subunit n=1 Tax=Coemansia javaensis TaxID=2761396 RepID=A0A9W8H9U8_9FUNG|nr:SF3a splicing factor complex subunit [Coemansia javaensis]
MEGADEKPAGMIYPPVDIKTIVDKTAEHVARSGEAFQQMIREKYQGNARFAFIYPGDPYFAYYEHMVGQFRSGKAKADDRAGGTTDAGGADEARGGGGGGGDGDGGGGGSGGGEQAPERPDAQRFICAMPAVTALDLDVIRLTAQFAARNGPQFASALAQREASNYQFDFLSPQHSLFGYFRQLVDQYVLAMAPPDDLRERLERDIRDKYQILDRAKRRMEWAAYEKEERKLKAEEAEREKEAFLSVDWHDFVVVGAVEFVEEDAFIDLPPPLRLQDLKSMSLADKHKASLGDAPGAPAAAPVPPQTVQPRTVPGPRPATNATEYNEEEEDDDDVEMDMEDESDVDEELEAERRPTAVQPPPSALGAGPMKIRKDYVPNLRRGPQVPGVTLRCQLCNLEIPAADFEEHIRVELIDPRWKEQKLVYERKIRDSNLVREGMDVAHYLKQLAQHRSDSAGSADDDAATTATTVPDKVYWDGHSSSAALARRRAREIAKNRGAGAPDPTPGIGPQLPPEKRRRA